MLATIQVQGYAPMVFRLYPDRAPITVANFASLADSGFFDGLTICRIVQGYVIQGGSPDGDIMTDSDFHIVGEFAQNGRDTGLDHRRGSLSMARDDAPDTAGTQFFVVHQDAHKLDGRYAAFGYLQSGFETLDAIAELPTSSPETWNKPVRMPMIESICVDLQGEALPSLQRIP